MVYMSTSTSEKCSGEHHICRSLFLLAGAHSGASRHGGASLHNIESR